MINALKKMFRRKPREIDFLSIIGSKEFKEEFKMILRKHYRVPNLDPTDEQQLINTVIDQFYILVMRSYVKKQ